MHNLRHMYRDCLSRRGVKLLGATKPCVRSSRTELGNGAPIREGGPRFGKMHIQVAQLVMSTRLFTSIYKPYSMKTIELHYHFRI
jgi:hypothetical protein